MATFTEEFRSHVQEFPSVYDISLFPVFHINIRFSYIYIYTNVGKLYLLPKIHKGLSNVPGCPVISNC